MRKRYGALHTVRTLTLQRGLLVVILISLMLVYGSGLWRELEGDELRSYRWYARDTFSALVAYTQPNNHLFHSLLLWVSTSIGGGSLLAIRFPAYAAGLLALTAFYHFARQHEGGGVALLALVFLGTTESLLHFGSTARGYTLQLLELSLLLILLTRPIPPRGWITVLSYLAVIIIPTSVFALFGLALWRVWERRDGRGILPMAGGAAIGMTHYLPALLAGAASVFAIQWGAPTWWYLFWDMLHQNWSESTVWIIVMAAGIAVGMRYNPPLRRLLLAFMVSAIALTIGGLVFLDTLVYGRNYLYLLLPMCLCAAAGWSIILQAIVRTIRGLRP